jgi:hypothetical protein
MTRLIRKNEEEMRKLVSNGIERTCERTEIHMTCASDALAQP